MAIYKGKTLISGAGMSAYDFALKWGFVGSEADFAQRMNGDLDLFLEKYFDMQRTGEVYQTKVWLYEENPSSICEKIGINAQLNFEPSTDTVEGVDDYANIPLFKWWHCNYIREDNTDIKVTHIKGSNGYAETGSVDVGSMGMTFYWNVDTSTGSEGYHIWTISDSPHPELGLVPWVESVRTDKSIAPYWCHSAFPSSIASDGLLRSQPNARMEVFQSHDNMRVNYQKKGKGYLGASVSRNTFQMIFNVIMGKTKHSQSLYAGVTNWNFQYPAAVQRSTVDTYFPLTASQAANLEVGCYVSVGYGSNNNGTVNIDRGVSTVHKYANDVKILRIESMEDGNKAVYLDVSTGFTTTPVKLTDTLYAPITISSYHMWTGETNKVIGHHNGSAVSNTSGRHSYRVQGTEYNLGAYIIASDTVMQFQSDYSKKVYVAEKGIPHSSSEATIKSTYKYVGDIPNVGDSADFWIGDVSIDVETGCWWPSVKSSSSSQGCRDYCYVGGKSTSGLREYLMSGALGDGSYAGSAFLSCRHGLSGAHWSRGGCD